MQDEDAIDERGRDGAHQRAVFCPVAGRNDPCAFRQVELADPPLEQQGVECLLHIRPGGGQFVEEEAERLRRESVVNFVSLKREEDINEQLGLDGRRLSALPSRASLKVKTWREVVYWTLDDPQSSKLAQIISVSVMATIIFS